MREGSGKQSLLCAQIPEAGGMAHAGLPGKDTRVQEADDRRLTAYARVSQERQGGAGKHRVGWVE